MSDPSKQININNSAAVLNVPSWSSEEESMRRSYENLCSKTKADRPRSCSPSIILSETKIVSKRSTGATPKTTGAIPKTKNPPNNDNNIQVGLDRYITVTKRKRSPSSANLASSAKITKNEALVKSNENRFAILQNEHDDNIDKKSSSKPPPIYLREKNSNSLVQSLIKIIGENTFYVVPIKSGTINETKIQVSGEIEFRKVVTEFEKQNKSFYTYQLKSSKGLQVVLKGIDADVEPDDIKHSLEEKGFKPKTVFNIRNREKIPQPIFRVELEPGDIKLKKNETHPIYNLKYLLYRKITVEQPHKRSGPVQCMNCQEYGHTKAYCNLPSVCVVCGELHNTSQCKKPREDNRMKKCSNCGENHTANYRGCPVYSTIKKSQNQKHKINIGQTVNNITSVQNRPPTSQSHVGQASYAGALRNNKNQPKGSLSTTENIIYSNLNRPPIQHPHANTVSYAGALRNSLAQPQGTQDKQKKKQNPEVNEHTPTFNFAKLESTIEILVQTVTNFTASMTTMMQEMMRMQSMLLQAVLNKP